MKIKMLLACNIFLATALPSLRISSLLAIVLLGTGALLFSVMYIQSIGSGMVIRQHLPQARLGKITKDCDFRLRLTFNNYRRLKLTNDR